ncbi:MAG TPA: transglycosylase SLT domain-containing protein [Bacteroidia bacterium]|nr:transglycosylase SLT domain-containing protein [Bacteroidia bacterium]HNU33712.1 transglycosylase SLT domain-containing protein [Bacteroidia bacterium]
MTIKKKLSLFTVLIAVTSGFTSRAFAQEKQIETAITTNDPIVSMLDSMVTLNSVIRFNELNPLHKPSDNSVPVFSQEEIEKQMAKIQTPIPLTYNHAVAQYVNVYAKNKRQLTSRLMGLSKLYYPLFEQELDKQGLPLEFKHLAAVESALNPIAVSPMGATGIWQFMYATGKMYGLSIGSYVDERRDPYLSTVAACKYFKDMYAIYGDWLLVIASYNCGPGNVNKAIARAGGVKNFWAISRFLPAETRNYVPAFIAATYVMNYAKEYNIAPATAEFMYHMVDTVTVKNRVTFNQLSKALDVPREVISFLNPIYKKGVVPGGDEIFKLMLPTNKIAVYIANESSIEKYSTEELTPVQYAFKEDDFIYKEVKKTAIVKKNETLKQFAQRTKCSVGEIKKWNKLASSKLKRGQKLSYYALVKVPKPKEKVQEAVAAKNDSVQINVTDSTGTALASNVETLSKVDDQTEVDSNSKVAEDGTLQLTYEPGKEARKSNYKYHTVQRGDTLWNIARRYDGTVEQLKQMNNLSRNATIKVGAKIKVPVNG